jgi:NO-binding membrane sensor protein with MHYT domain
VAANTPQESFDEVRTLVVAYVRQETLEPLAQLKRYLAFGLGGGLLLGLGVFFCAMAGLRALQTETGSTFTGSWSWAPYGIVVLALALAAAATWALRNRRSEHA